MLEKLERPQPAHAKPKPNASKARDTFERLALLCRKQARVQSDESLKHIGLPIFFNRNLRNAEPENLALSQAVMPVPNKRRQEIS